MHDTLLPPGAALDAVFDVGLVTRVEGEGSLHLRMKDGHVEEAHLAIFEAPRYFEQLVIGRTPDEVIDIVARICGICPIAYQMSAVHAFEDRFGVTVAPETRLLRRLLYCGEWIESHALHVYFLHAPDFLGYPSAIELAKDHREIVEQGLALKRTGNAIVKLLGGRPIHPVSVRVGGFSRAPRRSDVAALRPALEAAVAQAEATVRFVATLDAPDFEREPRLVALRHPTEYPFNDGRIVSSDGLDLPTGGWETTFDEEHVPWSHALQAHLQGGGRYLLGPAARVSLDPGQLHPRAKALLLETGLAGAIRRNPNWSIAARAIELVHAASEALEIADAYSPPDRPLEPWTAAPGVAAWSTEAPRGLLFHRYDIDERGLIAHARIVPPTSQNQAAIEADLAAFAPSVLTLPHEVATHRLEQLIRSYDPCISCATHFLDLRVEREG